MKDLITDLGVGRSVVVQFTGPSECVSHPNEYETSSRPKPGLSVITAIKDAQDAQLSWSGLGDAAGERPTA